MTEVIKKWEAILAKDLPNDIVYSRKVMIEMLTDFKQWHKPIVMGRSELLLAFLKYYEEEHNDGNWNHDHIVESFLGKQ